MKKQTFIPQKNNLKRSNSYFFFWFWIMSFNLQAQQSDFAEISFKNADSRALQCKGKKLESLPKLAYSLTHDLPTDVEKCRAIYLWVSTNIACDYSLFLESQHNRKKMQQDSLKLSSWNAAFTKKVFQKLLKDKKTVCTGYAYLIKELLRQAGIKSEVVDGYGRIGDDNIDELGMVDHSWNAIQLNNKWYLCDATWSSGLYDLNDYTFKFDYNDGFFLTDPSLFVKNHYPLDSKWLLTAKEIKVSDFLQGPIVYADAFKQNLSPIEPRMMHLEVEKDQEISFVLKEIAPSKPENLTIEISYGSMKSTEKPSYAYNKEGLLELKYAFKKTGSYDFHLKMGPEYLITYTVKVNKGKEN